jgi:hypothetical protein
VMRCLLFRWMAFLVVACPTIVLAHGRKPPDVGKDGFPDYNRLEMRSKPKTDQTAPGTVTEKPTLPSAPAAPPALNSPMNQPPSEEDVPQPAPKAVPVPEGASEPPLPDDIKNTLIQSTTDQK